MAEIKNCKIEISVRYENADSAPVYRLFHPEEGLSYSRSRTQSIIKISIPLPGGQAVYEIDITDKQKDSLEYAAKLSEKS